MTVGVIIANTGSPASPEPDDIEAYLREYLMDDRIRQLPKPVWKWLLHHHILPKRKHSSAARYRFIWTGEGSPLVANQRALCRKVQALYDAEAAGAASEESADACAADEHAEGAPGRVIVRNAMSYGAPSIAAVLAELRESGADRLVLLPLYPQSAYSPTMAVVDSFHRAQDALGWHPPSAIIDNYHDDPAYIGAVTASIRAVGYDPDRGDRLVLSLHAIPLKDERAGDTYRAQVAESARLIAAGLGVSPGDVTVTYQSVFGHDKSAWVSPLAVDVLKSWRTGDFRVVFCCPGFAIDCLETMYDIPNEMVPALEGDAARPVVDRCGTDIQAACNTDGRFVWVPSLNTSDVHARMVKSVIDREILAGERP